LNMDPNNMKELEGKVRRILDPIREHSPEPHPYWKTRILARLEESTNQTRSAQIWKFSFAFSSVFGVVGILFAGYLLSNNNPRTQVGFIAEVNKPYVLRVDLKELINDAQIASAEIHLSDGLYFYSETYPDLGEKRSLRVAWEKERPVLPFVLVGSEVGLKPVKIAFYNKDMQLVIEKEINIQVNEKIGVGG